MSIASSADHRALGGIPIQLESHAFNRQTKTKIACRNSYESASEIAQIELFTARTRRIRRPSCSQQHSIPVAPMGDGRVVGDLLYSSRCELHNPKRRMTQMRRVPSRRSRKRNLEVIHRRHSPATPPSTCLPHVRYIARLSTHTTQRTHCTPAGRTPCNRRTSQHIATRSERTHCAVAVALKRDPCVYSTHCSTALSAQGTHAHQMRH